MNDLDATKVGPIEEWISHLHTNPALVPMPAYRALLDIIVGALLGCVGLMLGIQHLVHPKAEMSAVLHLGLPVFLTTFGVYMALEGQRNLVYRRNYLLAAYLAELIRRSNDKGLSS
jgi:hypothetical protein